MAFNILNRSRFELRAFSLYTSEVVAMKKNHQPRLCPRCPLRRYLHEVKQKSWTRERNHESDLKLCMRLRALSARNPHLPECPHYPKSEDIGRFNGSILVQHEKVERFVNYEQKRLLRC